MSAGASATNEVSRKTKICVIAAIIGAMIGLFFLLPIQPKKRINLQELANQRPIFGMWVWQPQCISNEAEQNRLIDFCRQQGINRLLVQVHFDYESVKAGNPELMYTQQIKRFIREAAEAGIVVEALDGDRDMALAPNQPRALAKLDAILDFNNTLPEDARLVGMHYDIEPYVLNKWKDPTERQNIMRQYLDFHAAAKEKLHSQQPPMLLSTSIPFWYDLGMDDGDELVLEYHGQTKQFHELIQDYTDYIAVMSYRTKAQGDNSITEHLYAEVDYAEQLGRFVCGGMETIELKDTPTITFYSLGADEFWQQYRKVGEAMAGHRGFGGMMIHDYRGFSELLAKSKPASSEERSSGQTPAQQKSQNVGNSNGAAQIGGPVTATKQLAMYPGAAGKK